MIGRSGLFSRIALVVLMSTSSIFTLSLAATAAESWRVTSEDPTWRLNIRAAGNARARVLGKIPGKTGGLKLSRCKGNWCKISYGGVTGWVYKPYLKRQKEAFPTAPAPSKQDIDELAARKSFILAGSNQRPIPVFAFPDEKLPIAGLLPSGTKKVEGLGTCLRGWCYVRSGPLVGWMPLKSFALDAKPEEITATLAKEPDETNDLEAAGSREAADSSTLEDEALNETETTATNAAINGNAAAVTRQQSENRAKFYALAGLAGESSLPIYERPDGETGIVAWIPNSAKDVEGLKQCESKWCLIRWREYEGWVSRRHLADETLEGTDSFYVKGRPLWSPLEVLDQPNENAEIVGKIPAYATGITPIGRCNQYWCHVRYLGIAGWVRANFLASKES